MRTPLQRKSKVPLEERRIKMYINMIPWLIKGVYTVTMIPGDGIGPEIAESVEAIFAAAKVRSRYC
jgi:hypothetical protein